MLFTPYRLGSMMMPNRIVMAPMSRARAGAGDCATALMAEYYRQRASAGLVIGESSQISRQGQGYAWSPGLHTTAQIAGWRRVVDAVHGAGGRIFAQLCHAGRISHVSFQSDGAAPVAPSALRATFAKVYIDPRGRGAPSRDGELVCASMPRALEVDEIRTIVDDFARAACNAVDAGFDGVELHGAHGYLIQQFLDPATNLRQDGYGGSLDGRLRFVCEVAEAVVDAVGPHRVGLRFAPWRAADDVSDTRPESDGLALAARMDALGLAYLNVCEDDQGLRPPLSEAFRRNVRKFYSGTLMYVGGYSAQRAENALRAGWADLISFGRPFIANPDLPYRLRHGLPLAQGDRSTYFGGAEEGYTDYPEAMVEEAIA
ncbi:alkene reductase [Tahibacter amnicola]|uniref:Alkene reductase n=1 Tax=Tahibacter amnicola TaxID=2976241 RepID=A0ABY6BLF6_9GAMM|nr:alkene reductase [Tahibacter amnicola]UXI70695.1 alkene reductase [Tahibacter amnicola]